MVNPVPGCEAEGGEPQGGGAAAAAVAAAGADVPVLVSDPTQAGDPVVWVNAALARATGRAPEEVLGRSWSSLLSEEDAPDALAELGRRLAARETGRAVVRGVRRDGRAAWDELVVTPVPDGRGQTRHHVGVLLDVTARVQAERAGETARARLAVLDDVAGALAVLEPTAAAGRLVDVLVRSVPWAAVVLARGDLHLAAASSGAAPATGPDHPGRPRRPALPLPALPLPALPMPTALPPAGSGEHADPLVGLLLGRRRDPVGVVLRAPRAGPEEGPEEGREEGPEEGREEGPEDDAEDDAAPSTVSGWLADVLVAAGVGSDAAGAGAALAVPVAGGDAVLGLLVLGDPAPTEGPSGGAGTVDAPGLDHGLAVEVARRLGLALDVAGGHEQQRLLVETLQRAMLPELPSVPGLDVWSHHLPGPGPDDGLARVGGDWFDVLQPGGQGSGVVGVVVGDVVGHDVEAAAAMGQLRSVVRASAHGQEEPGTVLARVDQLVTGMRVRRAANLVYARLEDLGDGTWEMAWSRAGHLPPVLVQAGRARLLEGGAGVLVGVGDRPRPTGLVELGPGDAVVLCTDGLLGRRTRPPQEGLAALLAACTEVAGTDAAGTGEHLLEVLGDAPEDDLALLVVRVPGGVPRPGPRRRRWQLPGEASSVARARRRAAAVGALWGLPSTAQAELVVSELVANAVLHGWGTVGLRLAHDDEGLLVEVDDSNPAPPGADPGRREEPGGYGLHVVQRLSQWGWRHGPTGKTVWARLPDAG
ncbi:SpoIIE family protein phosphatase [Pseudokineococcus basanitobsidens]|uniref:SpoIIE family protein phosphatase n=1 Tax=Pseudokineococcus basanitobsidens TaxID=1926649 RepID=A0ABU8RLE0_9ACTN